MKKILLTILAVLAMGGMAMAQTAPSDINLHRNDDGSWSFIMPGRNLMMSTETFSTNDTVNGHYLAGVPEGWLILALGDTVPVSNDSLRRTTPITEGTPVTIVPTGNLRRIKSITLVDELPPVAAPTLTLGEMTQGGDPLNNGSGSETYFSPTFKEGDQIALVHGGVKDVVTVGTPNPDGSAPITGDITVGADNEDIVLVYPADLVAVAAGGTAYTENTTVTNKFKTQAGTLAYIQNNLDIRKGTGKLAVSGASASLKANVSMASQIAIWKLTMTGERDEIFAQKVTVKVGGNKVAEASASGAYFAYPIVIYLALDPATMGTGTLRIEADEFGTIYYYQKDGGVSLTAGKFYQSAVELER